MKQIKLTTEYLNYNQTQFVETSNRLAASLDKESAFIREKFKRP